MTHWLIRLKNLHFNVTFIVALLLGVSGGVAVGYFVANRSQSLGSPSSQDSSSSFTTPTTKTKAANLRAKLNNLSSEHVALLIAAARSNIDDHAGYPSVSVSLRDNTKELAAVTNNLYGQDNSVKFSEIWQVYIGTTINYADAVKRADKAGMESAVAGFNGYVEAISNFLSTVNPELEKSTLGSQSSDYITLIKQAIDKYAAGDFAGSYQAEQQATSQLLVIADTIGEAVVRQKPSDYKD